MARTDILAHKQEIMQWIKEQKPKSWIAAQLNCKQQTLNTYLQKMGIEYSGQQHKVGQQKGPNAYIPVAEYLVGNRIIKSSTLKEKLFREGLKIKKCERCGRVTWMGEPIPLELHHKNGNHNDNSMTNLEILCPNCHAFTENYRGRKNTTPE